MMSCNPKHTEYAPQCGVYTFAWKANVAGSIPARDANPLSGCVSKGIWFKTAVVTLVTREQQKVSSSKSH